MIDVPADIMHAAYVAAQEAGITALQETVVLVAAQLATSERARVLSHVDAAKAALMAAGDGSAERVQETAAAIIDGLRIAILSGEAL